MNNKLKKIFIADDDKDILDIMNIMLQTRRYEVEATTNATDIFDYKEKLPDLILLDIWMSGIDGREICRQLKTNPLTKNIPVIFISANSSIKSITEEYNADDYIAKPFEMEYFLDKIDYLLQPGKKQAIPQ
jgi:DNA-binding response OmpR family regulator